MTAETRLELTDPGRYKRRLHDLLAERAPLDVLAETPARLTAIVEAEAPERLRSRPFEAKWTPVEIIGHYVDVEWTFGYRTRAVLCDDRPRIAGIDQDLWVTVQRHNERAPADLVADFGVLRSINLSTWDAIPPEALERVAIHDERGEETLGTWLEMLAGHDLWHLDQLERYVAAARA